MVALVSICFMMGSTMLLVSFLRILYCRMRYGIPMWSKGLAFTIGAYGLAMLFLAGALFSWEQNGVGWTALLVFCSVSSFVLLENVLKGRI